MGNWELRTEWGRAASGTWLQASSSPRQSDSLFALWPCYSLMCFNASPSFIYSFYLWEFPLKLCVPNSWHRTDASGTKAGSGVQVCDFWGLPVGFARLALLKMSNVMQQERHRLKVTPTSHVANGNCGKEQVTHDDFLPCNWKFMLKSCYPDTGLVGSWEACQSVGFERPCGSTVLFVWKTNFSVDLPGETCNFKAYS